MRTSEPIGKNSGNRQFSNTSHIKNFKKGNPYIMPIMENINTQSNLGSSPFDQGCICGHGTFYREIFKIKCKNNNLIKLNVNNVELLLIDI